MTPDYRVWLDQQFAKASPRAVDFRQAEYEGMKEDFETVAAQHGYRLSGMRLGRAVFTSKPPQEEVS